MCGIAGYSLSRESRVNRTLAAQTLLAAIAERGSDAVGYAYRGAGLPIKIHKQRTAASELLDRVTIPRAATEALLHVRDYTKGHPSLAANNHPIRHGSVVGIHNGIIVNDEEIFERHGFERSEPGMTVDSEAIFALAEGERNEARALERLFGSMATAWVDERAPGAIFLARGVGRPLWIGEGRGELFFASTREALELTERYANVRVRKRELPEGSLVTVADGHAVSIEKFEPDRSFSEEDDLPAIRSPEERVSCLRRLGKLAAPATAASR